MKKTSDMAFKFLTNRENWKLENNGLSIYIMLDFELNKWYNKSNIIEWEKKDYACRKNCI